MKKECLFCGSKENITKEHVIPEGMGFKKHSTYLCKDCNNTLSPYDQELIKYYKLPLSIKGIKGKRRKHNFSAIVTKEGSPEKYRMNVDDSGTTAKLVEQAIPLGENRALFIAETVEKAKENAKKKHPDKVVTFEKSYERFPKSKTNVSMPLINERKLQKAFLKIFYELITVAEKNSVLILNDKQRQEFKEFLLIDKDIDLKFSQIREKDFSDYSEESLMIIHFFTGSIIVDISFFGYGMRIENIVNNSLANGQSMRIEFG